jgi:hypothetical protein
MCRFLINYSLSLCSHAHTRLQAWKEVSGKDIKFVNLDVAKEYAEMVQLFKVCTSFHPSFFLNTCIVMIEILNT